MVDRAERQRSILSASANVFAARGYRNATMDEIAAAAGIAKGTLYLSYDSKEALFFALFESFADTATLEPDALSGHTDALEQIVEVLCAIGAKLDADALIVPLTLEFWSASGVEATGERFGERYRAMLDMFSTQIVGILRSGQQAGTVTQNQPLEAITSSLLAIIDGLIVQRWVNPSLSIEAQLRDALPPLLAGLRP
nr:TetR/AcrR family transcriptional regulator [Stakelama sediminis]